MAYKTKVRVVLELEVPGDKSSSFDFHRYFNMKSGVSLRSESSTCLGVVDLGVSKTPKEITQPRAIIKGLVKATFGSDIKAKIKTRDRGTTNMYFDVLLFHVSTLPGADGRCNTRGRSIARFSLKPQEAAICCGSYGNLGCSDWVSISLADPDLINKMYSTLLGQLRSHMRSSELYETILACKGPGVTI